MCRAEGPSGEMIRCAMDLDLRHLQALVAVARHGNFTRAAKAVHVSQPTFTIQMHRPEQTRRCGRLATCRMHGRWTTDHPFRYSGASLAAIRAELTILGSLDQKRSAFPIPRAANPAL
jgi:hypothetical protein